MFRIMKRFADPQLPSMFRPLLILLHQMLTKGMVRGERHKGNRFNDRLGLFSFLDRTKSCLVFQRSFLAANVDITSYTAGF